MWWGGGVWGGKSKRLGGGSGQVGVGEVMMSTTIALFFLACDKRK